MVVNNPQPGDSFVRRRLKGLLTFLLVFGPGLIVMVADNDAGAVSTYIQAGAQHGKDLLWVMLLLLPMTYFVQEMSARLGVVTGKGHAAIVFQRFGNRWGSVSIISLLIINFLTLVTEFAAIRMAVCQLGLNQYILVPAVAIGLIAMAVSGSYRRWERIAITLCFINILWFAVAWQCGDSFYDITYHCFVPYISGGSSGGLIFLIIAIIGTTIAPWQVFFQQSCIADKKVMLSNINLSRLDTFLGACFTIAVAICMMMAGDVAFKNGIDFVNPAAMAGSISPIVGKFIGVVIPILMINAAVLGATAVSLASSWSYGEATNSPHGLDKTFREAPWFYGVYSVCVIVAAALVLLPSLPLQLVVVSVQVLAGLMLPFVLILLQILVNDSSIMGKFKNSTWNNCVNWIIISSLSVLSGVLVVDMIFGPYN